MPRDGSGNHSLPAGYEAVTGQTITANQHNLPLQDLSAEITASLPRDGSAAMTSNLPMGGNRISGLANPSADTDAVNRQTGDSRYILASGGQVETADIADDAVTTAKIPDGNVTEAKLETDIQTLLGQIRIGVGIGCGQFQYSSTTACLLMPYNGELVSFPNGDVLAIPSAGLSFGNGSLSADTTYYAYVYNNSGTLAAEWSTTAPATDSTAGLRIKTGDSTRVLVGMARTNGSTQFDYSAAKRNVATWHNRRPVLVNSSFTADRARANGSFGEINSEIAQEFVTWGDAVNFAFAGSAVENGSTNLTVFTAIYLDGTTNAASNQTPSVNGQGAVNVSLATAEAPSAGHHTANVFGASSGGGSVQWLSGGMLTTTLMI